MKHIFTGEVQLAGWSESHNGGCKVTFWLADPADLDAFRALTVRKGNMAGQIMGCALVEIEDGPQIQEKGPQDEEVTPPVPKRLAPLAQWSVMRCQEVQFQDWCVSFAREQLSFHALKMLINAAGQECGPSFSRALILFLCDVGSRKEIDGNSKAEEKFHERIRKPYARWLELRGVPA